MQKDKALNKKIAILGFAREGHAVYTFLKKNRQFRDAEIWILDQNNKIKIPRGVKSQLGKNYLQNLKQFDTIFRSPGIPYQLPEIQNAIQKGVTVSSATSLFFEHAKGTIVGVTGTKGKGTTSTLLYKILLNCDFDAYLAGNIGTTAIDILPKLSKKSITVFELSSFQLQDLLASPHIAVVLDIFPDHQDSHANFEEYVAAKMSIAKHQKRQDKIFFIDSPLPRKLANKSRGKKIPISQDHNPLALDIAKNIKIPGEHNLKNALVAATVAQALKCPKYLIIKTIQNFKGLEHRLELVKKISVNQQNNQRKSVIFYNDSASTNPQTTIAALQAFEGPKILIAGGKDKNLDYSAWARIIKEHDVKLVVLFGENKEKIQKAFSVQGLDVEIKVCENLGGAVRYSYEFTKLNANRYTLYAIIFSPGSASFDMFKDYADRGKAFKKLVNMIK